MSDRLRAGRVHIGLHEYPTVDLCKTSSPTRNKGLRLRFNLGLGLVEW